MLPSCRKTGAEGGVLVAHEAKAFEIIVIGPCTLVRTWGYRRPSVVRKRNPLGSWSCCPGLGADLLLPVPSFDKGGSV